MQTKNSFPQYRLIAQNMNNELIFEIVGQPNLLIRTAREAFSDHNLLAGLPPAQAALVGFIEGMSAEQSVDKTTTTDNPLQSEPQLIS